VADRVDPVGPRPDGVRKVVSVDRPRLLSPTERDEARRKREEARRKVAKQTDERTVRNSSQDHPGGVDYSV
jgi:hypothetical protein